MTPLKRPRLRDRIRRVQFVIGLGFVAAVGGALFSSMLIGFFQRHPPRARVLAFILAALITELWVLLVLPGLCYAIARIVELHPWRGPVGAAITGQVFILAVAYVSAGSEGVLHNWPQLLVSLAGGCAGVWLSHEAIGRARKGAAVGNAKAEQVAAARKAEYDDLLKASEALAERHDRSRAEPDPSPPPPATGPRP